MPHAQPEDAHRPHPAHGNPYGYGFSLAKLPVSSKESGRVAVHGGLSCGGSAMFQSFLDQDRVILFWNNVGGIPPLMPGLIEALADHIVKPQFVYRRRSGKSVMESRTTNMEDNVVPQT